MSPRLWLRIGLAFGIAIGVVAGLAWVGREAGLSVAGRDRYAVKVSDISCDSPPGVDRQTFLTEVRYVGNLPETVQAVDPGTPDRLSTAFAAHPWVSAVDGVTVTPDGEIRASLRFRSPILAVTAGGNFGTRAVDVAGVLLPPSVPTTALAELIPSVPAPAIRAGQPWPDADVKRGAELAQSFAPARRIEKTSKGWRITQADGKILIVGW